MSPLEGGPQQIGENWRRSAEIASETLYPGVLVHLEGFQPEGDRAVIQKMRRAEGMPVANDSEIAKLWHLSRFDERAYDQMGRMVAEGLCTADDIAQVFFRMTAMGLF